MPPDLEILLQLWVNPSVIWKFIYSTFLFPGFSPVLLIWNFTGTNTPFKTSFSVVIYLSPIYYNIMDYWFISSLSLGVYFIICNSSDDSCMTLISRSE